jgi:hypothetical protein
MTNQYTCPVCYYTAMPDPVEEGNICPCCGTEFGYDDDFGVTHDQLRAAWITAGAEWFSPVLSPPMTWNPFVQLALAGVALNQPQVLNLNWNPIVRVPGIQPTTSHVVDAA